MRNSRYTILLVAAGLLPAMANAQSADGLKADPQASQASKQAQINSSLNEASTVPPVSIPKPKTDLPKVLATWEGGDLTSEELSATLAVRTPNGSRPVSMEAFPTLPRKQQVDIVKAFAWEQVLLQEAKAAGINEKTPEVAKAVANQEETLLNRIYYQKEILPRLDQLTEETAREYYEENKLEQFTRPAETVMRALHVSTYEMVTAEEGDTLEDLAAKITGDPKAVERILQATPPFYLRSTPAELEDKVLSSPLQAGEVVMVPMNEDAVSSATALAEKLREELLQGKTVQEVAAATTGADFQVSATEPMRLSGAAAYWNELKEAAAGLDNQSSVSEVVRTPAGLNILVLEDQLSTQVIEFEDVKPQLIEKVVTDETERRQNIEEARKEILDKLWKKFGVQLNREIIGRSSISGSDPLSTDTVIAKADDFVYTLEQFVADLRLTGKDWGQLTENERLEVAKTAPRIINYVIAREARELGYDKTEVYKEAVEGITESQIVAEYRKKATDPEARRVTNDELRAYYNDHIDRYTSAAQVTVREISKRINMTLPSAQKAEAIEKAKASLTEIRGRIKSEEDFAQLARRESEAISTRSRGGLIGTKPDDFRGEAFKNQLRQLKPGDVSEPFLYGSEVMIIRLDERTAPTVQPFELVQRQVMLDYAATEPAKIKNAAMENSLKKVNFKLNF